MLVYQVVFPNGKKYIGCTTTTLEKRKGDHLSASKRIDSKFYRALNKYGPENVKFEQLADCESIEEMFELEKKFIAEMDTKRNGYNSTTGGEGNPGREYTEEDREKISEAQRKRFERPEERRKMSNNIKNWRRDYPDEYTAFSQRRLAVMTSQRHREKMSAVMKDYYAAHPEKREQMSDTANRLYRENPDVRQKISSSLGGRPVRAVITGVHVQEFPTFSQAVRELDLNLGNAHDVLKGRRSMNRGVFLEYADTDNGVYSRNRDGVDSESYSGSTIRTTVDPETNEELCVVRNIFSFVL